MRRVGSGCDLSLRVCLERVGHSLFGRGGRTGRYQAERGAGLHT